MRPAEVKSLVLSALWARSRFWLRMSARHVLTLLPGLLLGGWGVHPKILKAPHWSGSGAVNGLFRMIAEVSVRLCSHLSHLFGAPKAPLCAQSGHAPEPAFRGAGVRRAPTQGVGLAPTGQNEARSSSPSPCDQSLLGAPSSGERSGFGFSAPAELDAQTLPFVWDALISELAHELNSPLSSLKGMIEVFSDHPGLGYTDRENLQIMCRAAANMEKVIYRAQNSRVGKVAQAAARRSLFDVNELLAQELDRFRSRFSSLGVQVSLSRSGGEPLCYGQPELFREAVGRVICNSLDAFAVQDHGPCGCEKEWETVHDEGACDGVPGGWGPGECVHPHAGLHSKGTPTPREAPGVGTPSGGRQRERWLRLTVDSDVSEGYVRILHQDNADGMSPETLQECVHPFFSTRPHALGLGLVIAKSAAERLGGQFEIQSAQGFGTTLRFTLRLVPASLRSSGLLQESLDSRIGCARSLSRTTGSPSCDPAEHGVSGPTPQLAPSVGHLGKRHLVVVDDDETVIALLKVYLSGAFQLTCCGSASLALSRVRSLGCDAVLTDLRMPVISGLELSGQIRAFFPDLPVIVMSGNSNEARELVESGAFTGLIEKPFASRAHLVSRLNELLARDGMMVGDRQAF